MPECKANSSMGTWHKLCVNEWLSNKVKEEEYSSLKHTPLATISVFYICAYSNVWDVILRRDYSLLCLHYRTEIQSLKKKKKKETYCKMCIRQKELMCIVFSSVNVWNGIHVKLCILRSLTLHGMESGN